MIKLLVVDDEPGICDILKKTFSSTGFTVLSANSGQEAVVIVKKEKPKIVFLDVLMPGMSGLEVLEEIKRIDNSIKVNMVTVMDNKKTRDEAARLGADEFVTKPFNSQALEDIVTKQITQIIKPKILVVDDESDVAERMSSIIKRRFDCIVESAQDGYAALEKIKNGAFDIVLIDIKMPGLSGIDVIKQAVKFSPKTKFLAISGYDSHSVADQALEAGAIDFLPKPVTDKMIETKLKHILGKIGKY